MVGRERNGGPALAAFQMSADTGAIIGPVLAGLLIDHGSYPLAFGVTGLVTLLAVIPWLLARETHDVRHGTPTPRGRRPHRSTCEKTSRRELTRRLRSRPTSTPGCRRGTPCAALCEARALLHGRLGWAEHGVAATHEVDDGLAGRQLLATLAGGPLAADPPAVQSPTPSASSPTARQVVTARGRW